MSNELTCCPVCGRAFEPDAPPPVQCPRCDADLARWFEVADAADRTLREAIAQLPRHPQNAARLARRARFLHATPLTRALATFADQVQSSSA